MRQTIVITLLCSFITFLGSLVLKVYALEERVQGQKEMLIEIKDDVKFIRNQMMEY